MEHIFPRQYSVFFLPAKMTIPLLLPNYSNILSSEFFSLTLMKSSDHNDSNSNVCQSVSVSSEFALSSKKAWISHLKGKAWVVTIASDLLKSIISGVKYRLELKELNKIWLLEIMKFQSSH